MALNWNITEVKDWDKTTEEENVVLNTLIWMTMAVGMREITEKNHIEFHARVQLIEKLHGSLLHEEGKDRLIKLEEVKRFIGLSTNASTLTRNQFNKNQLERFYKERLGE